MNSSQQVGACAIITNAQNQILLGKRKNSYKAGMYGLPGGRVEINEPLFACIEREVMEETGMEHLTFSYVGVVRENQGAYDFIHFVFSAKISNQEPTVCEPDKCENWEWVNQSANLDEVLPGHVAGIELYRSGKTIIDLVK